ncbi:MAG: energy-coupling factor transporter transmembrane protein EcfT [Candidatus Cloacimonetes bacterium]|nr:energy-coupling factor transporter transmembrane protein EcfT [Candidatus Cloacimonadota bacterium]
MKNDFTFHIKTILIVNIILTSGILLSKSLTNSLIAYLMGLIALVLFYGIKKLCKYLKFINRFKTLFITLILFQLLLRRQGEVYFEWPLIKITDIGFYYAFNSLLRYLVILLSATMLSSASPYQMIKALRTWKLPEMIIIVVSFTIQFLRQLQVDFKILKQNLEKRNITFKGKSLKKRFELVGKMIIPVIGSLFSDIKYKVIAMELNGYGVNKRIKPFKYQKCCVKDYVFICIYLGATIYVFF